MAALSKNIDPNKIFIIQRSELEGRIDPVYSLNKKAFVSTFIYPLVKIGSEFIVKDGDHDKLPPKEISDKESGKRYLRSQDLKDNLIIENNPIYISEKYFQKISRCHIYPGDLLISIMASVGSSAIVPDDYPVCTANRAVGILRKKEDSKLLPEYVQALINTKVGMVLFEMEKKGGIQQRLNLSDITNVKLPTPPIEIQKAIIEIYHDGLRIKQQKAAEANTLLNSIDTYLLKALGIALPEKDHSLNKRIFTTQFSEVTGGRFDVFAVLNKDFKIEGGKFENKKLKQIASLIKGQSITSDKISEGEYPVIAGGQSSPYNHNQYNQVGNVITVSASGAYSGYVWYHDYPIFASDCTVIQSKDESEISTLFLSEVLKTKQQEIYHLQQGAGQPHVYSRDLAELFIPIPPQDKQKEIVAHIQTIRQQAKKLQEDALSGLEEAKRNVEKQLLAEK